ncbi:MAG TPA: organomercurial lyase [Pseudonocardiaceae bacterium]|nr:organomercurial lyase [Pseudonocardiaceae bacterium]
MNTTGLAEFDRAWRDAIEQIPLARLATTLGGLTRLGERPASLTRLAAIIDMSTTDTLRLLRQNPSVHIDGDAIRWEPVFPGDQTRRTLYVGDREIPMRSGCAPDLFVYAAVLDVLFRVEETCPATGRAIHVELVPDGYRRVDPPETVTVLLPPQRLRAAGGGIFAEINDDVCAYQPFFSSAQAARSVLAAVPGSRTFTVAEMLDRPFVGYLRDRLRPLIHPAGPTPE